MSGIARRSILVQPDSAIVAGTLMFEGADLRAMPADRLRRLRARRIAMVVQDPAASLNPVLTIGHQLTRIHRLHGGSAAAARTAALALLDRLRIADPEARLAAYPHQLSGGMKQRLLIAMALICRPALLIADAPTTALDVTVEAEIFGILAELRCDLGMALLLISHNLTIVARMCDRVAVMYAGRIVETGPTAQVMAGPRHPYTKADGPLPAIPGEPPNLASLPPGCAFAPRCPQVAEPCAAPQHLLVSGEGRLSAC